MDGLNSRATWLLFCRERLLKQRLQWSCVCGAREVETELALTQPSGYYSLAAVGTLHGAPFSLEAEGRSRLQGDTCDSHVPLFLGTFEHQGGVSGDFTIRPRDDGELMTLGVYGARHSIRLVKAYPNSIESPLEVHGIPDTDIRFERFGDAWHPPSVHKDIIPAKARRSFYAGRCITEQQPADSCDVPPMLSVLVTMTVAYNQLLLAHHMRGGD